MITIEGINYIEKRNLDENLPSCSMCKIPLSKCKSQCQRFGDNYFFVTAGPEDIGRDVSGCLKGVTLCAIVIGIVVAIILILT